MFLIGSWRLLGTKCVILHTAAWYSFFSKTLAVHLLIIFWTKSHCLLWECHNSIPLCLFLVFIFHLVLLGAAMFDLCHTHTSIWNLIYLFRTEISSAYRSCTHMYTINKTFPFLPCHGWILYFKNLQPHYILLIWYFYCSSSYEITLRDFSYELWPLPFENIPHISLSFSKIYWSPCLFF